MSEEDIKEELIRIGKEVDNILKFQKSINIKLDKLVNQRTASAIVETLKDEEKAEIPHAADLELHPLPKTGKYTWYPLDSGLKVRRCSNQGCDLWLFFNEDKGKYEHGKYDGHTFGFVADKCDHYIGGSL